MPTALASQTPVDTLEHDGFFSHHSALGEAYNLWVSDAVIRRPPLYRRRAIFLRQGRWQVGYVGLNDLELTLPTGLRLLPCNRQLPTGTVPFTLNEQRPSELTLYTRYYGVAGQGRVLGHTPAAPDRRELTVVDRRVVGWQVGGNLALPLLGFARLELVETRKPSPGGFREKATSSSGPALITIASPVASAKCNWSRITLCHRCSWTQAMTSSTAQSCRIWMG